MEEVKCPKLWMKIVALVEMETKEMKVESPVVIRDVW